MNETSVWYKMVFSWTPEIFTFLLKIAKLLCCAILSISPPQICMTTIFFRMGQIWEMWKGNTGSLKMCLSLTVRSSATAWILVTLWKNPECASIISDIFVSGIFDHKYRYYVASGHVRSPSSESVMFRIIIICIQMIMVSQWCTVIQLDKTQFSFLKTNHVCCDDDNDESNSKTLILKIDATVTMIWIWSQVRVRAMRRQMQLQRRTKRNVKLQRRKSQDKKARWFTFIDDDRDDDHDDGDEDNNDDDDDGGHTKQC